MSKLRTILLIALLFAIFSNQNISANSQDVPKVPAVISQTEFDYQGTHFVVQLIPSWDAVVRRVDATGGLFSEGDFALRSAVPAIVLRSESSVLSEITAMQDAEFVMHIPDPLAVRLRYLSSLSSNTKRQTPINCARTIWQPNGSDFRVFLIQQIEKKFKIKPVEFSDKCYGDHQGALFGSEIKTFYMKPITWITCVFMVTIIQ